MSTSPDPARDPAGTLTVAVVGAGVIGRNHVAAMLRIPRLRVVAVVDPVTEAATTLASSISSEPAALASSVSSEPAALASSVSSEPTTPASSMSSVPATFASLSDALASAKPQVVVICTPSGQHVAQAMEALAAGAHVVIEKPLDVTVARARPLLDAARSASGQVVSVISQHRFDPATVAVNSAIRAGRFGRLTSAVATVPWWRGQDYYDSAGWRGTLALDGGGALMNQGVHTLDLLLHFLGRPVSVFAYTDRLAHTGIEVEDVLVAVLRFESGALATLHATTAAYPGAGVRVQLHGSRGSAVLHDDQLESASFAEPGEPVEAEPRKTEKPGDNFVVGHLRQYEDIVEAILTGRPPGVTLEDGFLALAVVEAIYESARSGQPVSIDGIPR